MALILVKISRIEPHAEPTVSLWARLVACKRAEEGSIEDVHFDHGTRKQVELTSHDATDLPRSLAWHKQYWNPLRVASCFI